MKYKVLIQSPKFAIEEIPRKVLSGFGVVIVRKNNTNRESKFQHPPSRTQLNRCRSLLSLCHSGFLTMKRTMPWNDDEEDDSSDESSSLHSDSEHVSENWCCLIGKGLLEDILLTDVGTSQKQKSAVIDFEALKRHGYKGGPSVLKVPPPKQRHKERLVLVHWKGKAFRQGN
ncbi:hypothetical protein SESBI_26116 [Sesbania bispinosa]|nr:hypothetical protein SESBI_26116 [Sesbania bispinosa]